MNWIKSGCVILGGLLLIAGTGRAAFDNLPPGERAYQVIVERNPFGVRPLPPPVQAPPPTNPPPSVGTLKLTGFTTLGMKRAFFVLIDDKTKTNQPISRSIDQDVDGLKLLDIDANSRQVRVVYNGVEKLMSLATDGITNTVAIAGLTGTPGVPGVASVAGIPRPGSPVPVPTVTPGVMSPNVSNPGLRTIPSRNVRTSTASGDGIQPIYAGASAPFGDSPPTAIPVTGGGAPPPTPAPQPDRTFEEQVILLEAQRQFQPDLPPTPGLPPPLPGVPR